MQIEKDHFCDELQKKNHLSMLHVNELSAYFTLIERLFFLFCLKLQELC